MAQFDVQLQTEDIRPSGDCEVRVTDSAGKSVTFLLRPGETVVTNDAVTAANLRALRVLTTRATRPTSPTHDVDAKPRGDLPKDGVVAEAKPAERAK
jgi:hypothetical protein